LIFTFFFVFELEARMKQKERQTDGQAHARRVMRPTRQR